MATREKKVRGIRKTRLELEHEWGHRCARRRPLGVGLGLSAVWWWAVEGGGAGERGAM